MRNLLRLIPLLILAVWFAPKSSSAQAVEPSLLYYPYNHLKWYTVSSEHFEVHFQEGNDRTARVVVRIAEEVYGPITDLYRHEPSTKVSIVLKDREDYSNGAAYFFDNKIEIWVPALDSPLRGTNNWLRNVISHEFTHIVQVQAAMKRRRTVPGIYLQWLGYENVRRPDVLYGYPNVIVTYPFFSINVPAWLAEGTAQFMRQDLHYDTWDAHRDMILRTRILEGKALSLDEMGTFGNKIAIEREVVYNAGFAFTRYLADRFGEDVLFRITDALSQRGVQTVTHAIQKATGINGYQVYDEWVAFLGEEYAKAMEGVRVDRNELVEPHGFVNFHPMYSPDGTKLYYLSNRFMDTYRASLYVKDVSTGEVEMVYEGDLSDEGHVHSMSCGHSADFKIRPDASAFDISPDGTHILFSQIRLNRFGETYRDLHLLTTDGSDKVRRITDSARLHEASFSPDGARIAAVHTEDGTQNLVFVDAETGEVEPLTHHTLGERIYRPVFSPDGEWLYIAYADTAQRSIRRVSTRDGRMETVLAESGVDFRDPVFTQDGTKLVYASDRHGIFNLWQLDLATKTETQLTSVPGGAFMPFVGKSGDIVYSEYRWDGYKIAVLKADAVPAAVAGTYDKPLYSYEENRSTVDIGALNAFNDKPIPFFTEAEIAAADTSDYRFADTNLRADRQDLTLKSYDDVFTSFSFFPTLRFDNYTKLNGSNTSLIKAGQWGRLGENLWRDTKAGVYLTSRDVTDQFTIFGGILLGLGSLSSDGVGNFFSPNRLAKLDRDMFLQVDYNGLPFIKRHWSPTVTLELTNLRRNVPDGLSVEEFPCISCLPDTSYADVSYDIFEAALYFRSKLSPFDYIELGGSYSPYKVATSSFISKEYKSEIAGLSSRYYIGSRLTAAYVYRLDLPWQHGDIAPVGIRGWLRYNFEPSRLLDSYSLDNGSLSPEYKSYSNHSVELYSRYGFMLGKQNLQVNLRGYAHLKPPDDDFYLDYFGGLTGMRSYPFFALGGYRTVYSTVSWNVPVWKRIDKQINRFTIDKMFLRLFAETGKGWGNPLASNERVKSGVGAELRLGLSSNYMLPTRLFISSAYGFNEFDVILPEQFVTASGATRVRYGRELLLHFGMLFDFEL